MHGETDKSGDFERLLLNAVEAERHGVFNRTPVDANALMCGNAESSAGEASPRTGGWLGVARKFAPLAACVVLSFGIGKIWLTGSRAVVPNVGQPVALRALAAAEHDACRDLVLFDGCFTGPSAESLSGHCSCVDFDRDGDVDWADFGLFQRAVSSSTS